MSRAAFLFAFLIIASGHTGPAQAEDAGAVYAAFDRLLGSAEQRDLYALPPDRNWRARGLITVFLRGGRERSLSVPLMALADDFGKATGLEIRVRASAKPEPPERLAPDSVVILVAGRGVGAGYAAELGIVEEQRRRFADGRWPALVHFRRNDLAGGARAGAVILADDISLDEQIAFLGLSLVWALGGASIGDDIGGIVDIGGRPGLTDRGRRAFALMYDPQLEAALPLSEVRSRARGILGLSD